MPPPTSRRRYRLPLPARYVTPGSSKDTTIRGESPPRILPPLVGDATGVVQGRVERRRGIQARGRHSVMPISARPIRLPILEPLVARGSDRSNTTATTAYPLVRAQQDKHVPVASTEPVTFGSSTKLEDEFPGLVNDIRYHPMFKSLQYGCCDENNTNGNGIDMNKDDFDNIVSIESLSKKEGLRRAMSKYGALNVFMSAMMRAWKEDSNSHIPFTTGSNTVIGSDEGSKFNKHSKQVNGSNGVTGSYLGSKLSENAKKVLEKYFEQHFANPYPSDSEKAQLASEAGIEVRQVVNWFGNRRMRLKRKQLQNTSLSSLNPKSKWRSIMYGTANPSPSSLHSQSIATASAPNLFAPLTAIREGYSNDVANDNNDNSKHRSRRFS